MAYNFKPSLASVTRQAEWTLGINIKGGPQSLKMIKEVQKEVERFSKTRTGVRLLEDSKSGERLRSRRGLSSIADATEWVTQQSSRRVLRASGMADASGRFDPVKKRAMMDREREHKELFGEVNNKTIGSFILLGKAITQVQQAGAGLLAPMNQIAGWAGAEGLGIGSAIKLYDQYNRSLLQLSTSFRKYGVDTASVESQITSQPSPLSTGEKEQDSYESRLNAK